MSISAYKNDSNIRVKPFQINEIVSLEKKQKFCERPHVSAIEKDSGKQIVIELQTIVYEYIKTNCVELIKSVGPANTIGNPIEGKDEMQQLKISTFSAFKPIVGTHTPLPLISITQTAQCLFKLIIKIKISALGMEDLLQEHFVKII